MKIYNFLTNKQEIQNLSNFYTIRENSFEIPGLRLCVSESVFLEVISDFKCPSFISPEPIVWLVLLRFKRHAAPRHPVRTNTLKRTRLHVRAFGLPFILHHYCLPFFSVLFHSLYVALDISSFLMPTRVCLALFSSLLLATRKGKGSDRAPPRYGGGNAFVGMKDFSPLQPAWPSLWVLTRS